MSLIPSAYNWYVVLCLSEFKNVTMEASAGRTDRYPIGGPDSALGRKKLVFLIGAPRSGTTWLQLLLSQSAHIATAHETHLFNAYLRSCFDTWDDFGRKQQEFGLHHLLTEEEYGAALRMPIEMIFGKFLREKPAATVILEKTPSHALYWQDILRIFPNAHFLHIVRDPRSVVASLRAASTDWASGWAPRPVAKACQLWIDHVASAVRIPSATSRYFLVRYRDLIDDGSNALKSIFRWLEIEHSEEECHKFVDQLTFSKLQSVERAQRGPNLDPQALFFRRGTRDAWKTDLSKREIALIERLTNPWIRTLGYELTNPKGFSVALASLNVATHRSRRSLRWYLRKMAAGL